MIKMNKKQIETKGVDGGLRFCGTLERKIGKKVYRSLNKGETSNDRSSI